MKIMNWKLKRLKMAKNPKNTNEIRNKPENGGL
jgi:hypothetical protein